MTEHFVDGSGNRVLVEETDRASPDGRLLIVRMENDLDTGYIATVVGEGGFGDEQSPSSYNRPCAGWFGPGERHATADEALAYFVAE